MANRANGGADATPIEKIKNVKARKQLPSLCVDYRALCEEEAAIKAAKKAMLADITAIAKSARIKKVAGEGWLLVRQAGGVRKKIVAEALLEQGVDIDIIECATETTPVKASYQVRRAAG
jgi:hypothetical protein